MGWTIKLIIGVFVLLVVLGVINIDKFIPDKDEIKAGVSEISSVVKEIKSADSNTSSEITENIVFDEEEDIDTEKSFFEFEGYALGKSHNGAFDEWEGKVLLSDDEVVGVEATFQTDSVDTGIRRLNNHLKSDDFFDVEKYPEIIFVSNELEGGFMKGTLTFRGIEKQVFLPVKITDDGISSKFFLDTTEFDFKYTGVDEYVKIDFNVVY